MKKNHGVGPGESGVMKTNKCSRGSSSLRKSIEREANKCFRGFSRMATIVKRTEQIIAEEEASLERQRKEERAKIEAEQQRREEIMKKLDQRRMQAALDPIELNKQREKAKNEGADQD